MKNFFNFSIILSLMLIKYSPILNAHPGHLHYLKNNTLTNSFLHSLTGLDHIIIIIISSLLVFFSKKNFKFNLIIFLFCLFGIVSGYLINIKIFNEYTVIVTLIIIMYLFLKSKVFLINFLLVICYFLHGYIHGIEINSLYYLLVFSIGFCITSFSLIYFFNLFFLFLIKKLNYLNILKK